MTDLNALADRVEGLSEPDRELDARIAHAICWRWDDWEDGDVRIEDRPLEYVIERVRNSSNSIWQHLPRYSASLDAAMTLVPEGWFTFMAGEDRHSHSWIWHLRGGYGFNAKCRAAAPALALTGAALRAYKMEPKYGH